MIRGKHSKTAIKAAAAFLALILMITGCSAAPSISENAIAEKDSETAAEALKNEPSVLRVGTLPFEGKFSPFYCSSSADKQIVSLAFAPLLDYDREGSIVTKGISGQTVSSGGEEYTYYGISDLDITEHTNGQVYYDFTLREDVYFSDGEQLTADDVIFTMYVLCDPSYDGSSNFASLPIKGLKEYTDSMVPLMDILLEAGSDNLDFTYWTEEQQTAFWADLEKAGTAFAQQIVDYCVKAGYVEEGDVAGAARNWSFNGLSHKATATDFFYTMCESYNWDLKALDKTEAAGASLFELMDNYDDYNVPVEIGDPEENIFGIIKTGEHSLRVVLTEADYTAVYKFAIDIAPMHYYGDEKLYDYENDSFGFAKGDLSKVRSLTSSPLGAGAYSFASNNNGSVTLLANEHYYRGRAETDMIKFTPVQQNDMVNSVEAGDTDLSMPLFDAETEADIRTANGGELTGDTVRASVFNNINYGYIGMNAEYLSVNGEPDSEASKNLRNAFGVLFSAYRDEYVEKYFSARAKVIEYPISDTSWAAPREGDDGFTRAFSADASGRQIYSEGMSGYMLEKAAKEASLGFFAAAGYTVEAGAVTGAPQGASLSYEIFIPAEGTGDHPCYELCVKVSEVLAGMGIELKINDLVNTSTLWPALNAQETAMWAAAWGAAVDPDMYKIYYSGGEAGVAGGSNFMYSVSDEKLNELIINARSSLDFTHRKGIYRECLEIIRDWAVEIPVYQKQDVLITSAERIDSDSVPCGISPFYTWTDEAHSIRMTEE